MSASGFIAEELAARVGWTLIHSLWQIALIGGLFWMINRSLALKSAKLRYGVGCVAMVAMLVVPVCWLVFWQNPTVLDEVTSRVGSAHNKGLVTSPTTQIDRAIFDLRPGARIDFDVRPEHQSAFVSSLR